MDIDRLRRVVEQDWVVAKTLHLRIWRKRDFFLLKWLIYCHITLPTTVTGISFYLLYWLSGSPQDSAINMLSLTIFLLLFPLILGILLAYFLNLFGFVKRILSDPWFRKGADSDLEYSTEKYNQVMDSSYKWFVRSTTIYVTAWLLLAAVDIFLGISLDPATDLYLHLERGALFLVNHSPFAPVTEIGSNMDTLHKDIRFMLFFTVIIPAFMYTISYRRYMFVANRQGVTKSRFWRMVWSIFGMLGTIVISYILYQSI